MKGIVTNKAGIARTIGILILSMALFTNVDLALAGGKKVATQLAGKGVRAVDAETGFDGLEWLKLYKTNGWDKSKYVRHKQDRLATKAAEWSQDLEALHQKLVDKSKSNKLSEIRRSALRPFSKAQKVSDLMLRGELKMPNGVQSAGTTTILLNGSDPDTIQVGDSLEIVITLSGDTAFIRVFWDANNNQMIDAGDFDLFEGEGDDFIVDNGFEDEDTAIGTIKLTLFPGGEEEGDDDVFLLLADNGFLFEADDGTAADTAALWIETVPTGFSVNGNADGYENVVIFAESCSDEFCTDFGGEGIALTTTDTAGNFTLDLPTSSIGYWIVGAFDVFDVTGGLFPSPPDTIVYVFGDVPGLFFDFIVGDATIIVSLEDNNGVALEGVPIFVESEGFGGGLEDTTDALGVVSFNVIEGGWRVYPDPDWLLPDYLVPFTEHIYTSSGGVTVVNFVAYLNDNSITGTTFLDNIATGGFEVRGTSLLGFTLTTSNVSGGVGDYLLPVSSYADAVPENPGYCVSVCHLSANQFVVEDGYNILSGADSVDIHILTADGLIEGTVYDIDTGMPIEFAFIQADEVTGVFSFSSGTNESGYYEMPVLNGDYTVGAEAFGYLPEYVDSVFAVNNDTVWVDFYLTAFDAGEPGAIEGFVYDFDTGSPIPGARVEVFIPELFHDETFTDESGYYWLGVPGGLYGMFASAIGFFGDFVDSVTVNGDTVWVDFQLEESGGVCYPDVWAVYDVPNDQGRQARVIWPTACLDFADITGYSLWRLVDDQSPPAAASSETQIGMFQEHWDYIDAIPYVGFPEYSYVAPTLGDSISPTEIWWSTFMVIAHTEFGEIFLPGLPGVGYSVDNLIPEAPTLSGMLVPAGNELTWTEIVTEEAKYYTVYRSVNGGLSQPVENTTSTMYLDTDVTVDVLYTYRVTATDFANQEGLPSNEVTLTIVGVDGELTGIPAVYALDQNYPNPFNPTTRINYQIPNSGSVSLKIYNLKGELVSTLVDEEMTAGYHSVTWNGLTSSGSSIASGVYLYRIQANDFVQVRKMIMMK